MSRGLGDVYKRQLSSLYIKRCICGSLGQGRTFPGDTLYLLPDLLTLPWVSGEETAHPSLSEKGAASGIWGSEGGEKIQPGLSLKLMRLRTR